MSQLESQLRRIAAGANSETSSSVASSSKTTDPRLAQRPSLKRKFDDTDEEVAYIRSRLEVIKADNGIIAAKYNAEVKICTGWFTSLYNAQMAEVDTLVRTALASHVPEPVVGPELDVEPPWKAQFEADIKANKMEMEKSCAEAFDSMLNDRAELCLEYNGKFAEIKDNFASLKDVEAIRDELCDTNATISELKDQVELEMADNVTRLNRIEADWAVFNPFEGCISEEGEFAVSSFCPHFRAFT